MIKEAGMFTFRSSFLSTLCATAVAVSGAATFDTTTVNGVATVGVGGDYATLADAATAFSGLASPYLQGNWKLEILNDLTEPANSGFANTVPAGSSLTIKPATGTSVTLTFAATVDNGGASGNLLVGLKSPLNWTDMVPTDNVTLDGSNNGTNSRNMTIVNTPAVVHSFSSPVAIVGDSNNITVKNLYIHNVGTFADNATNIAGVTVSSRYNGTTFDPDFAKIQNCEMIVRNGQGHGVNFRMSASPAIPTGTTVPSSTGNEVSNCQIHSRLRGIFMDNGIGCLIDSNIINVGAIGGVVTGYLEQGVGVNNSRSDTGQVLTVSNNQIFMRSGNTFAGNNGLAAFNLVTGGTGNIVNFYNNMINFQFTTAVDADPMAYVGFRATSALTYNILNNSINMPDHPNLTGLSPTTAGPAVGIKLPVAVSYTATIKNNILRIDQAGAAGIVTNMSAGTKTLISDNNIIFRSKANSLTGVTGSDTTPVTHLTLSDWQTATSLDANSAVVDPTATTGSSWQPGLTNADLHFVPATGRPVGLPTYARLPEVLTDIDGQNRSELATLPGADEVYNSSVSGWTLY